MGDANTKGQGSMGNGRCKGHSGRAADEVDEPPSRGAGLDGTWWDWLTAGRFFGRLNLRSHSVALGGFVVL